MAGLDPGGRGSIPRTQTKVCPRCGEEKPLSGYSPHRTRGVQTYCRPCKQSYDRAHHAGRSPEALKRKRSNALVLIAKNITNLHEYLLAHPCVDCGEADPIVLEFDHPPGSVKEFNVADMIYGQSWTRILREIAKCEVRCANCHRKITHQRRQVLS